MRLNGDRKPTLKQAINSKLRVLRDFCVFDGEDKEEKEKYRQMLWDEVNKHPTRDYEIVLDHFANKLIMERLS